MNVLDDSVTKPVPPESRCAATLMSGNVVSTLAATAAAGADAPDAGAAAVAAVTVPPTFALAAAFPLVMVRVPVGVLSSLSPVPESA